MSPTRPSSSAQPPATRRANPLVRLVDRAARIGVAPDDPPDVRIRKGTLAIAAITVTMLSTAWVAMYLLQGRPLAALLPLTYQLASLTSLWWFARTRRYDTFRVTQVVLILLLPVVLQWSLGGFENGSAVMLWAFVAPVGALVFGGPRAAVLVFGAFVGLTLLSGVIDPLLAADADPVPEPVRLALEHGLTMIKTGGDSWMAVSGVPEARPDHAEAAAEVALRACEVVGAAAADAGETIVVRIGMHSGPLAAGVIGTGTYAFDVWGQTVAIASRMESLGLPGRIQVSLATALFLAPRYVLAKRGTLEVKGVGEMEVYLLEGRR